MIRFLNIVQGLLALVFVVGAALSGWAAVFVLVAVLAQLGITLFIVIGLRDESPKGPARELVEGLILLILGLGGFIFWLSSNGGENMFSPSSWWMAFIGLPSVLINLGVYVSTLLRVVSAILEWFSGETAEDLVEDLGGGGGGAPPAPAVRPASFSGEPPRTAPPR